MVMRQIGEREGKLLFLSWILLIAGEYQRPKRREENWEEGKKRRGKREVGGGETRCNGEWMEKVRVKRESESPKSWSGWWSEVSLWTWNEAKRSKREASMAWRRRWRYAKCVMILNILWRIYCNRSKGRTRCSTFNWCSHSHSLHSMCRWSTPFVVSETSFFTFVMINAITMTNQLFWITDSDWNWGNHHSKEGEEEQQK